MIWRSTTFRFAALVFGLQVVSMAILLVGLRAILREQSHRQAVAAVETIRDDLLATRAQGGDAALAAAIRLRAARPVGDGAAVLLTDAGDGGWRAIWPAGQRASALPAAISGSTCGGPARASGRPCSPARRVCPATIAC